MPPGDTFSLARKVGSSHAMAGVVGRSVWEPWRWPLDSSPSRFTRLPRLSLDVPWEDDAARDAEARPRREEVRAFTSAMRRMRCIRFREAMVLTVASQNAGVEGDRSSRVVPRPLSSVRDARRGGGEESGREEEASCDVCVFPGMAIVWWGGRGETVRGVVRTRW